jgi:hypothetical protein
MIRIHANPNWKKMEMTVKLRLQYRLSYKKYLWKWTVFVNAEIKHTILALFYLHSEKLKNMNLSSFNLWWR